MRKEVFVQLHSTPTLPTYSRPFLESTRLWTGSGRYSIGHIVSKMSKIGTKPAICVHLAGAQPQQRASMHPYNVGAPSERIALDVLGPLPSSELGNKYVLLIADYFTKWPEAYSLPNQEAITVAEVLMKEYICRFGVPLEIHSDQG
jgi:hypothetical protein